MCTEQEGTKRDKGDQVQRYRGENKTRMMQDILYRCIRITLNGGWKIDGYAGDVAFHMHYNDYMANKYSLQSIDLIFAHMWLRSDFYL